jgi:hypothetical protein
MATDTMFLIMVEVTKLSSLLYGFLFKSDSSGGSVASAKEAMESMIKLTHNIWMAFKGVVLRVTAPIIAVVRATQLTVSWN